MRAESICIFEDELHSNFFPLTYLRPVFDLRCGMFSLREKISALYDGIPVTLFCRKELEDTARESSGCPVNAPVPRGSVLFINGRAIPGRALHGRSIPENSVPLDGPEGCWVKNDTMLFARLSDKNAHAVSSERCLNGEFISCMEERGVSFFEGKTGSVEHVWDLVELNGDEIEKDFRRINTHTGKIDFNGVSCLNSRDIVVEERSTLLPGVVIDATAGPVYIGSNVKVYPHAYIEGPSFIGDGSLIKAGTRIYGGTSIGEVCKVGGEVEKTIFHSFSNKQHDGFIGLSYIGSWCNLGAGTSTSDLKNNYGSIRMRVHDRMVDTGRMFLGAVIGDHTKTGINTIINTGSVIGIMVNIFGGHLPPKYIPSFTWASDEGFQEYRLDKAIEVARRVMDRRGKTLSPGIEDLLSAVFASTAEERRI